MSDRPLTRRELRELERQQELAAAGGASRAPEPESQPEPPAAAAVPDSSTTAEPEPQPEPPAAGGAGGEGSRPLTRRELRELAAREAEEREGTAERTAERTVTRRPVQEPTTTTNIPAFGSVAIPLGEIEEEPESESAEATVVSEPAEPLAAANAEVEAVANAEPDVATTEEPEAATAPERVSLFGSEPAASSEAAREVARDPAPVREAGGARAAPPGEPAWDELVGADPEADLEDLEEPRPSSTLGTVLRYVALVVAFFIIGALIWMLLDRRGGEGGAESAALMFDYLTPLTKGVS
ncbi:MAG: hypothetical protein Q4G64_03140 [bacterium]|nr:hypothetical protein [bacterium]